MNIKLADTRDIPIGKALTVHLEDGRQIALFNINGSFYALENVCPHMGGPLGDGEIEDSMVTCPWHGWQFDIKTGLCINVPGDDASTVAIEIKGDEIFLKE